MLKINNGLSSVCLCRADEESSGPSNTNVKLRYNGELVWDSPAITKSTCVVDVSYFPFDWQQCNLTFGSWTYNGNQVCLNPDYKNRSRVEQKACVCTFAAIKQLVVL